MNVPILIAWLVAASWSADADLKRTKPTAKPVAKTSEPGPRTPPKTVVAKTSPPESPLMEIDRLCRRDQARGRLEALRSRCVDLSPSTSAIATYWRLMLSDDPNDLRKGFFPATLGKGEVDSRLLLAAGRYHFARGQIREMEDLLQIARKAKIEGSEIDTLKHLAAGR